jgi:dTDP-4-dehydrorhamnose reductase
VTDITHAAGAANRFPEKVDKNPDAARAINVEATKSLAKLCSSRSILLIYVSTDYVFPGVPGDAPYQAEDTPKPTNLYGQTKLDGEKVVLEEYALAGKEGLGIVFRVPVLYGNAETPAESAVNVLLDTLWASQQGGAKIKMDHWALRYPTNTEDCGRVLQGMFLLSSEKCLAFWVVDCPYLVSAKFRDEIRCRTNECTQRWP